VFQVGAIHGWLLTAWSAAGVAGPLIINGFLDAQAEPGSLTSGAYRPALFTMVGVLAVGFLANALIRPVAERFHEQGDVTSPVTAEVERFEELSDDGDVPGQSRLVVSWLLIVVMLGYGVYETLSTAVKLFE
jgi:MFS family permease